MRQVLGTYSAPRQHWVGDGFPVRSMLSHHAQGQAISPFIMLDYAGPARFEPTSTAPSGIGRSVTPEQRRYRFGSNTGVNLST